MVVTWQRTAHMKSFDTATKGWIYMPPPGVLLGAGFWTPDQERVIFVGLPGRSTGYFSVLDKNGKVLFDRTLDRWIHHRIRCVRGWTILRRDLDIELQSI